MVWLITLINCLDLMIRFYWLVGLIEWFDLFDWFDQWVWLINLNWSDWFEFIDWLVAAINWFAWLTWLIDWFDLPNACLIWLIWTDGLFHLMDRTDWLPDCFGLHWSIFSIDWCDRLNDLFNRLIWLIGWIGWLIW